MTHNNSRVDGDTAVRVGHDRVEIQLRDFEDFHEHVPGVNDQPGDRIDIAGPGFISRRL